MSNGFVEGDWIWKDGEFIRWEDATVHLLSLAVQFGSSVFEGIRCYATDRGPAIFRLSAHLKRLTHSCRTYRMDPGWTREELAEACRRSIRKNDLQECYLRPMVVRGYGAPGLNPAGSPVETYLPCWPWGEYLGEGALEHGVDVCVSSWSRPRPNTYPVRAKAAGHYNNAQLIKMEALEHGYDEAIVLGPDGLVSEGSGQNLFLVEDGDLVTPTLDGTSLPGITRNAVITLAGDLDVTVREESVARERLYAADELFFTGTASEVTPVVSVDGTSVGDGGVGPLTRELQELYLGVARGEAPDRHGWLTHVDDGG